MYAVTHFTVGLMLGQVAGNPYAAFALGLASHVILDAIPHSDYSKTIHGIADFVAVMAACYVSVRLGAGASGLVGGFSGVLPDLEVAIAHLRSGGDLSAQKCRFFFPSRLFRSNQSHPQQFWQAGNRPATHLSLLPTPTLRCQPIVILWPHSRNVMQNPSIARSSLSFLPPSLPYTWRTSFPAF
jgi:hypothetical protein